jgi:hypothetical protein
VGATNTADIMNFMRGLLFVALGIALYSAYCLAAAPRLRDQAAHVPTMTCDQLIRNGPGARRYVALTEACLLGHKSVSEWDGETGSLELYHPLYPASLPEAPQPRDLTLVLCIRAGTPASPLVVGAGSAIVGPAFSFASLAEWGWGRGGATCVVRPVRNASSTSSFGRRGSTPSESLTARVAGLPCE